MPKTSSNSYKNKTDKQLVKLVKSKADSASFNEICERYENIFYKICQKYANTLTVSGVNPQDIFEEKNSIIYHCINTYDARKKAKLSTWIGNYARYLCLNTINSRKFIIPTTSDELNQHIEDSQQRSNFLSSSFNKEDYNYISNLLSQLKDKRINDIIQLRYFSGRKKMIWINIAKKMNLSTQTAINLHNKGIELLRNKIKSKYISDKV